MYRASWMSVDEYIRQRKIVTYIFKEVANARQAS
jgi:hypothetical protein